MSAAGTVEVAGHRFPVSELLGPRARGVYEALMRSLGVPGDLAECGVYDGTTASGMADFCRHKAPERLVHLFDSFTGFPDVITEEEWALSDWLEMAPGAYAYPVGRVQERFEGLGNVRIHSGLFSETFPGFERPLCFIHSDSDLYRSTAETLEFADRLLVPGGILLIDDFGNPRLPGVEIAVRRHLSPGRFEGSRLPDSIQFLAVRK